MVKIKIDKQNLEVREGIPVIQAAAEAGVEIPSMCWREGKNHITSCMICLVKDAGSGRLFPSCSVAVSEGMEIISMDDEIREARKTALDLLLSEHVGDCTAPCQLTCPAHMNIPLMNRYLAKGDFENALKVVKKDIALPSVFGRICSAPCEGACYRKSVDEPVSICLLKRAAGDEYPEKDETSLPAIDTEKNKKVSIIGAGPAGLSAAWYLRLRGYKVDLIDRNAIPGGSMRLEVEKGILPAEILEKETDVIRKLGVKFSMNTEVNEELFAKIQKSSHAILICSGSGKSGMDIWGLPDRSADPKTFRLENSNIFIAGSALKPAKMAIKALGQGKEAAFSIDQFLQGKKVVGEYFMFNSRFGKLAAEELSEYMKESIDTGRLIPENISKGFSREEVIQEAARCMHCDCRDIDTCRLRIYSDLYKADQKRYHSEERRIIKKYFQHKELVYEPGKCIKCGICVDIAAEYKEELGMTFIGRGFDVEIGIPFTNDLQEGLKKVALLAAGACPTGALSEKNKDEQYES